MTPTPLPDGVLPFEAPEAAAGAGTDLGVTAPVPARPLEQGEQLAFQRAPGGAQPPAPALPEGVLPFEPPAADAASNVPAAPAPAPEDVDARLRTIFQLGLQINPSEAAGVNYLARTLDLPPALVAQQYPLFRKAAEAVQFDPARFRRENPGLVELLLDNPLSFLHPAQAEQVHGVTTAIRASSRLRDWGEAFVASIGGPDPEGVRAMAIARAVTGQAQPTMTPPTDAEIIPPPKMVPTRQSELKGQHGLATTARIIGEEGRRGLLQNELGDVGFAFLVAHQLGENTDVLRRRQIEIEQELGVQVDYGQNAFEQLAIDAEKGVMSLVATLKEGGKAYAVGAGIGGVAALAATRSPREALRAAHAVGMIFGKIGFSYGSFKQESGTTLLQLMDEQLDDGTPLDPDVAAGAAFIYGVAAAAVEVEAFGELAKSLGPLKTMIERGEGRAAIRGWVADRSKWAILKQIGAQWGKSASSEALEEGTQNTLQYAITWAGKSFAAGSAQRFDKDAWIKDTAESMYLGGLAGGAMAAPGTVLHAGARLQAFAGSRGRGEVVAQVAKLAGTEAALGAPQAVAELVSRESRRAGAGDITAAYLDAEAAETFFQTQGTTAGEALSELLGEDMRAKVAAAQAGENLGRIEIPLATYLEKLGPTGVAEALAGDTAVRPFDATLNEQARQQRDLWAEAEDAVQLWQKTGQTPAAEPGEVEWAKEIAAKATASGAAKKTDAARAQLVARAFVRTMIARYGEPVRQLMGRYAIDVRPAEAMPALADAQAAVPQNTPAAPVAPGRLQEIEARLAEITPAPAARDLTVAYLAASPQEQARIYFLDPKTGLNNHRALWEAPADPARPLFAQVQVAGKKAANDTHGHQTVDVMFRAVGRALLEAGGDLVSKVGGDLMFRAADQAEADRVLEAARAKLPAWVELSVGVGERRATLRETVDGITATHGPVVEAARSAGTFAGREAMPAAFEKVGGKGGRAAYGKALHALPAGRAQVELAPALLEAHAQLAPRAAAEAAYRTEGGLLTAAGWEARRAPGVAKAHVASMDLRKIARLNAIFGHEVTDAILLRLEQKIRDLGGAKFDAAHLSGDEFALQSDDPAALERFKLQLKEEGRRLNYRYRDRETGEVASADGLEIAIGIGRTWDEADGEALRDDKARIDAELGAGWEERRVARGRDPGEPGSVRAARGGVGGRGGLEEAGGSTRAPGIAQDLAGLDRAEEVRALLGERLTLTGGAAETLRATQGGAEQGWTRFYRVAQKGLRQLFQVATTPNADASTLLHESAHVFLEIFGDVAGLADAPLEAREEYSRILEWLGAKSRTDLTREQHERFAGAFETYLYEGKAPSLRLAGAFAKMRAWFLRVGAKLKGSGVPLNDEIRGLFDRMLAVDDEIATVRDQYAAGAAAEIFPSPEAAGLTPEQYDEYLAAKERAFADARIRVQQRLLAEQQIANAAALRAAGKTAKEQAAKEFDDLRESRVLRFLRKADALGNPALRALVEETREQEAKETSKVEVPAEFAAKLKELDRQEEELQASGGTRRTLVVVGGEFEHTGTADGRGVPSNLVPLFKVRVARYEGQRLGYDEQLRVVTLPAWLGDEEYSSDRAAWEWVWAAAGRRLPQAEQRWLHDLVGVKELARAWAAGRILAAHDRTDYQQSIADQIRGWLAKAPAARIHDSPLAPRQWETIAEGRNFSRFRRWEIATGRTIKDNVTGLGEAIEPDAAGDTAVALREEGDGREGLFAEIEAARADLDRQVAEARVAQQRGRVKLDLQAVVDAVGNDAAGTTFRGLTRPDGGMSPDRLAEIFGFPTGEGMLKSIAGLADREAWVQERADQLLEERHPTLLADRGRLAEAIADAAHAKGDIEFFLRQWEIFRSKAGDRGRAPIEAVERAAQGIVKGKKAGRLNLKLALDAETGAARRAAEAAGRGNWRQAAVLTQQQILNHFIYKAMVEVRGQRDELERMAKTMTPEKYRGQIGRTSIAIRDAIDQILEATGLRERIQRDQLARPLSEAIQAMEAFGTSVMLDQEFLERIIAQPVPYGEMLVSNMQKVLEALKNLRAAALSQQEVIDGDRRVARDAAITELELEAARTTPTLPPAVEGVAKGLGERISSFGATVHGEVLRIETMVRWLGGRDTRSAWYRMIMLPLQAAKAREVALLRGPFKAVIQAFETMPAAVRRHLNDKVDGKALFPSHRPDLAPPTRRFQLLMMLLSAGNLSNLSRLLEGRGITIGQLERALSTLTRAELEWAQQVWDACESLWPLSRELEERDAGVSPPKIEPRMMRVISKGGEEVVLRGGYFPAVYVREVSTAGEKQTLQTVQDILSPGFTRPGTPHSHLKGRVEDFADAIATDPAIIMRHLTQVAHDLAFREPLKSVASLVLDERIQDVLKRRLGAERSPQFLQWLKDIGSMRAAENAAGAHGLVKFARKLKSNAAIGILGYAADVAAGDILNLGVAVVGTELKAASWARGITEFTANPFRAVRETGKLSGELAYRRQHLAEDFRRHIEGMTSRSPFKKGFLEKFRRFAFVFMEATDLATSTPIWMGAYQQAAARGLTQEEAIVFADAIVRRVFPSHSAVDASFMVRRKDGLDLFLLFHGYANTLAQLYLDKAHQIHEAEGIAKKTRKTVEMVAFSMALGLVGSVAADFIVGHGPTDDDKDDEVSGEEWASWFVERLLLGWAYPVPLFGWVAEAAVSAVKGKRPSARAAPIYSGLEGIGRSVQKAIAAEDRDQLSEKEIIEILKSAGILAGVPAVRPARVVQGGIDLWQGEVDEADPNDVASLLLYGERAGGLNPLRPTK